MATKYEELVNAEAEPEDGEEGGAPEEEATLPSEPIEESETIDEPPMPEDFDPSAIEKENARHEKALAKLLGEGWAYMGACAACGGVGFVPLSYTPPPEVRVDESLVVCDACNGYGFRQTPSLAESYVTTTCTSCSGHGYRNKLELEAEAVARQYQAQAQPPPPPPQPVWNPATNQWETPPAIATAGYPGQPVYPPTA